MNPRQEAQERLGDDYEARVLEPSPPAVSEAPWFADDPAARANATTGRLVVCPTSAGDRSWSDLCVRDEGLAAWCSSRWLGAWSRLPPLPSHLVETRGALHTLAEHALCPARHAANGKIGLRFTRGGFGTPFFGDDQQVRVEGAEMIVERAGRERPAPISTVRAAAELAGIEPGAPSELFAPTNPLEPDRLLEVEDRSARFIGEWFGFGASILEQLRAEADTDESASRVQLWPEHFDMAVEIGSESAGRRAAYGCSPGDATHPEPYVYVAPWAESPQGEAWNERHFRGARLSFAELADAPDQRALALDFCRRRREELSQR